MILRQGVGNFGTKQFRVDMHTLLFLERERERERLCLCIRGREREREVGG